MSAQIIEIDPPHYLASRARERGWSAALAPGDVVRVRVSAASPACSVLWVDGRPYVQQDRHNGAILCQDLDDVLGTIRALDLGACLSGF